jgi:hypothetical protein
LAFALCYQALMRYDCVWHNHPFQKLSGNGRAITDSAAFLPSLLNLVFADDDDTEKILANPGTIMPVTATMMLAATRASMLTGIALPWTGGRGRRLGSRRLLCADRMTLALMAATRLGRKSYSRRERDRGRYQQ